MKELLALEKEFYDKDIDYSLYGVTRENYNRQVKLQEASNEYRANRIEKFTRAMALSGREVETWYGKYIKLSYFEVFAVRIQQELEKAASSGMNDLVMNLSTNKLFRYYSDLLRLKHEGVKETGDTCAQTIASIVFDVTFSCFYEPIRKLRNKNYGLNRYRHRVIANRISTALLLEINHRIILEKDDKRKYINQSLKKIKAKYGANVYAVVSESKALYKKWDMEPIEYSYRDRIILGEILLHAVYGMYPKITNKKQTAAIIAQHKEEREENKQLAYWTHDNSNRYARWMLKPCDWLVNKVRDKNEALKQLNMVRLPMLVKPRTPTRHNGYARYGYLKNTLEGTPLRGNNLKLVKYQNKEYYKKHLINRPIPIMAGAIKAVQQTPHRINKFILSLQLECLDKGIELENGVLPRLYEKKMRQGISGKEYKLIKDHNEQVPKDRAGYVYMLSILTDHFRNDDPIYFPIELDKRGRLYYAPYPNPQGADYQRSLFEFKNGKQLSEKGIYYIKVWTANVFKKCFKTGENLSNATFEKRVKWVDDNIKALRAMGAEPLNYTQWQKADKPFVALRACHELYLLERDGHKHVSHMRVDVDFTCSGLQIVALLLQCNNLAEKVNLLPTEKPTDVYIQVSGQCTKAFKRIVEQVPPSTSAHPTSLRERALIFARTNLERQEEYDKEPRSNWGYLLNKVSLILDDYYQLSDDPKVEKVRRLYWQYIAAEEWLVIGITRSIVKRACMTFSYSSKPFGMKRAIYNETLKPLIEDDPNKYENIFPCKDIACYTLAESIYKSMQSIAPTAALYMEWMQESVRTIIQAMEDREDIKPLTFITPLNFVFESDYRQVESKSNLITLPSQKINLSIQTYGASDKINKVKTINAIAPNITHLFDATLMFNIVYKSRNIIKNYVVANHDCFGVHANYVDDLHKIIRQTIIDVFKPTKEPQYFKWLSDNGTYRKYKYHSSIEAIYKQFRLQAYHLKHLIKKPPIIGTLDFELIRQAEYCCS